jgi:hypothetical protein
MKSWAVIALRLLGLLGMGILLLGMAWLTMV